MFNILNFKINIIIIIYNIISINLIRYYYINVNINIK